MLLIHHGQSCKIEKANKHLKTLNEYVEEEERDKAKDECSESDSFSDFLLMLICMHEV